MIITAPGSRSLVTLAAAGPLAALIALIAGCGSPSSPAAPGHAVTVTVTAPPSSGSGGSPGGTASPSASAPVTGPAECATSDLKVSVGQSNGAAGTIFYNLDFTNTSGSPCVVQGYPGVSLVTASSTAGSQIGAAARRNPVTPSTRITLNPGDAAHAMLGIAEAGNFPPGKCHMVTAHWLKVFPPDQTVAAYAPLTTATCSSSSAPTLQISALSSGA